MISKIFNSKSKFYKYSLKINVSISYISGIITLIYIILLNYLKIHLALVDNININDIHKFDQDMIMNQLNVYFNHDLKYGFNNDDNIKRKRIKELKRIEEQSLKFYLSYNIAKYVIIFIFGFTIIDHITDYIVLMVAKLLELNYNKNERKLLTYNERR